MEPISGSSNNVNSFECSTNAKEDAGIKQHPASFYTRLGQDVTSTVVEDRSNVFMSHLSCGEKDKCPSKSSSDISERSVGYIADGDNRKEQSVNNESKANDPNEQLDDTVVKENCAIGEDCSNPSESYKKCKDKLDRLDKQIENIKNSICLSTLDGAHNKDNIDELIKELTHVSGLMEDYKKKIVDRKSSKVMSYKVCEMIKKTVPDYGVYEAPKRRARSIRERLTSICNKVKKCLAHKGLVKALRIIGVILNAVIVFAVINAIVVGIVFGSFAISPALGLIALFIVGSFGLLLSSVSAVAIIQGGIADIIKHRPDEIKTIMEEISLLAQCLSTENTDISALRQLIFMVEDNSFLSGEDDYDEIYSNLVNFLRMNPCVINDVIDDAKAHDTKVCEKMMKVVSDDTKILSLKEVDEYYEILNTWEKYDLDGLSDKYRMEMKHKLGDKVLSDLACLPGKYGMNNKKTEDLYKHVIKLTELQSSDGKNLIVGTRKNKNGGDIFNWKHDENTFINYMEHLSKLIGIAFVCDDKREMSEDQKKIFNKADKIYHDIDGQLLEISPKYKKKRKK